jgi:hypothetical protein
MKSFILYLSIFCIAAMGNAASSSLHETSTDSLHEMVCGLYSLEEWHGGSAVATPPHMKGLWIVGGGIAMVILQSDEEATPILGWGEGKLTWIAIGTYTLDLDAYTLLFSYDEEFVFRETSSAITRMNTNFLSGRPYSITFQNGQVHGILEGTQEEILFDCNGCTQIVDGNASRVWSRCTATPTNIQLAQFDTFEMSHILMQNYPNPFNPLTSIEYSVPKSGDVSLAIYNSQGQFVTTLVNDNVPAGRYSISWNGKDDYGNDVSSGTYFYKLRVNDHETSKKMIKVK